MATYDVRAAVRASRGLQSIMIQVFNHDLWQAQVEIWAEEDSRVIIQKESLGNTVVRDWEEMVACHVV